MNRDEFLNELCRKGIVIYGVTWEENLKRIQELKKYKDMWEGLGKEWGHHLVSTNYDSWTCVRNIMNRFKQRYFPEEAKKELMRKKLKGLLEVVDELKRLLNV